MLAPRMRLARLPIACRHPLHNDQDHAAHKTGPALYAIDVHQPFADAFVDGLLSHVAGDLMCLANGLVLLPNNRAKDAVRRAFIRRAENGVLLPRLMAIGDVEFDSDYIAFDSPGFGTFDVSMLDSAAVIDPFERVLRLAQLVQETHDRIGTPIDAAAATHLAQSLAKTLDELQIYRKTASDYADLNNDTLQTHWKRTLILLELLSAQWPDQLTKLGKVDLVVARNAMLDRVARRWRSDPPAGFVIAAGISTTAPAITALLQTILRLPQGMVVLAGLDRDMPDAQWAVLRREHANAGPAQSIGVTQNHTLERHPQYAFNILLDAMGMQRDDVKPWMSNLSFVAPQRRELASKIFVPAEFSNEWNSINLPPSTFAGMAAMTLANPAGEAQAIALMLREALEHPGKTAALVTPDRNLAERVSAHLARWGIIADDSAGQSLLLCPQGGALMGLAQAFASYWGPVETLSFLKNPLIQAGEARLAWLDNVRLLDRLLRGPRPAPGLAGIENRLADIAQDRRKYAVSEALAAKIPELLLWWNAVVTQLSALDTLRKNPLSGAGRDKDVAPYILALQSVLETLCGAHIWQGPEGRALADRISGWMRIAPEGPALKKLENLPDLVRFILSDVQIRTSFAGHPRIFIWGVLEARLQTADRIILGGLNEGTWPRMLTSDPWLPPGIRHTLGLPGKDMQTGLSAQDFAGTFAAPEWVMTRAIRDESAPTIASRFWLRLEALAGGNLPGTLQGVDYAALTAQMDALSPRLRISPPAPNPPLSARPEGINVTDVDMLQADPFAYYAKNILRLSALDRQDAEPGPAWRGSALHDILEHWTKSDGGDVQRLMDRANHLLNDPAIPALTRALWGPKMRSALLWVADQMAENAVDGRVYLIVEDKKTVKTAGINLTGKPDRIDRMDDGRVVIVDYKSGSSQPSATARADGFALQLGLLAHMAKIGAFKDLPLQADALEYWLLGKRNGKTLGAFGAIEMPYGKKDTKGRYTNLTPDNFPDFAANRLAEVANKYLLGTAPFAAKIRPQFSKNSDYDQLMRYLEWFGRTQDGAVV